jgi:hypothetical protein
MRQARLIIRDEVNVKIEGLELDVRRALVNKFKYDVPYARYLPAVRLGRWDGKVAFGLYVGELYFIGHSMLGHIALVTMVFVTWWVFRGYQEQAKYPPRHGDNYLRAPDRSARDDEMSDEQRQQLARNI